MMTAVRQRMTHRALIERRTDSDGRYDVPTWGTHIEDQPCWLWTKADTEMVAPERTAVVSTIKLLVPLDADINVNDRINGVTNRAGVSLLLGKLNITGRTDNHDHAELFVERVRGT